MSKPMVLTVEQYRTNYTRTALEQLLYVGKQEADRPEVAVELVKIREALDSLD